MTTETYDKTFTVTGIPMVKVGNINGKIEVFPGDEGQVHVTAIKHTYNGSADRTEVKIYQNEEGHVIVETKAQDGVSGWFGFIHRPAKVDYTVTVPKECNLHVNSVSGETTVRGLSGDIKIGSVSGTMVAEDIAGTLKLNTVSGKVEGSRLSGPLTLETVSGRVNLTESNLPALKANTVSGSLTLETPLGEGPYRVSSVSGSLTLIVPENSNCTADVSSVSGRIHTNFPLSDHWKNGGPGRRHHRIKIGEGGPEIKLNSVSGILRVTTPEAVVDSAEKKSEPVQSHSPINRMEVLDRIARGELSADEGLAFLQPN